MSVSYGQVVLSYAQDVTERAEGESSDPFVVSARFLRGAETDRQAARHLFGEEIPEAEVEIEGCSPIEAAPSARDRALSGSLELLDAGELVVHLEDEEGVPVPDWSFPSVYGVVAGVFYGGEGLEVPYRPETDYRVTSTGSSQIEAFEVALVAPDELARLTVAGAEVGVEPVRLDEAGPMAVRWEPGAERNEVVVELSWFHFGAAQRVICRSRDDGAADLPAAAAMRLAEPGATDARLSIFRATRSTVIAEGIDEGEALFIVSVTFPIR